MLPRSAFAPRWKNAPRPYWKVCEAFRQWLRGRPCACGGRNPDCGGHMEAAHVDYAAKGTPHAKGGKTKVADRWSIPLTRNCHRLQHLKGWPWFDRHVLGGERRGEQMSIDYWHAWPGRIAFERQQEGSR